MMGRVVLLTKAKGKPRCPQLTMRHRREQERNRHKNLHKKHSNSRKMQKDTMKAKPRGKRRRMKVEGKVWDNLSSLHRLPLPSVGNV